MIFYQRPFNRVALLALFLVGFMMARIGFWFGLILFILTMISLIMYVALLQYLGIALIMRGRLQEALIYYTYLLKIPGNHATKYARRAAIRSSLGDLEGAIEDYSAAIKIKGDRDPALYGIRSALYLGKRDYKSALEDSDHLLSLHPDSEMGYANRAAAKMFLHDVDGAIEDCTIGLEHSQSPTGLTLLYNNRGTAFRISGEYTEAMANYNLAMSTRLSEYEKAVLHPSISTNQGFLYYLQEDFDNARVYFQQANFLNPAFHKALVSLAVVRYKLGQLTTAKELWHDLLKLEPRYDDIHFIERDLNLPKEILADVADMMQMLPVVTKY